LSRVIPRKQNWFAIGARCTDTSDAGMEKEAPGVISGGFACRALMTLENAQRATALQLRQTPLEQMFRINSDLGGFH